MEETIKLELKLASLENSLRHHKKSVKQIEELLQHLYGSDMTLKDFIMQGKFIEERLQEIKTRIAESLSA